MDQLHVRNWARWQSYRSDRGQPPWIKVHRSLLRDPDFVQLSDAERGQLVVIWVLAADRDGVIPASPVLVGKLCYMDSPPDLELFVSLGFLERRHDDATVTPRGDASVTPGRRQHDRPEAETEAETEKRQSAAQRARAREGWPESVAHTLLALYGDGNGREGTDERVWGPGAEPAFRSRCLAIARERLEGEGSPYRAPLFRKTLLTVIAEQRESSDDIWEGA